MHPNTINVSMSLFGAAFMFTSTTSGARGGTGQASKKKTFKSSGSPGAAAVTP